MSDVKSRGEQGQAPNHRGESESVSVMVYPGCERADSTAACPNTVQSLLATRRINL